MYHNCFFKVHLNPYTESLYREYHNPTIYIFYPYKGQSEGTGMVNLGNWEAFDWA